MTAETGMQRTTRMLEFRLGGGVGDMPGLRAAALRHGSALYH